MAVVNLDDPSDVAAWNRRAPAAALPPELASTAAEEVTAQIAPASQPVAAPVGMEPVAWVEVRPGLDGWFLAYNFNPDAQTEPLYSGFQVQAMLAAARKPLTDEKLHALYADEMAEYFVDALHYWRGTPAHQYARAIEQAHGIKATNPESNK